MLRTIARHVVGATAAWLMFCVEGAGTYVGLLVFAAATDADPGGPLAGPFLLLVAAVVGGATTALVLFPSVLAGEAVGRFRWLMAQGVSTVLLGLAAIGWSAATATTVREATTGWLITVAATVLPLTAWSAIAAVLRRRAVVVAHWHSGPAA